MRSSAPPPARHPPRRHRLDVGGLVVDRHVGHAGQLALGVFTVGVLAALLVLQPTTVRLQTLAVVGHRDASARSSARSCGACTATGSRTSRRSCHRGTGSSTSLVSPWRRCSRRAYECAARRGRCRRGDVGDRGSHGAARRRTSRARSAARFSSACLSGHAVPSTPASSWSWSRSSSTARRSARGRGSRRFRASVSRRGTLRAASRVATSCSTSSRLTLVARLGVAAGALQSRRGRRSDASTTVPARMSSRAESTLPQTSQSRNPRALPSPST